MTRDATAVNYRGTGRRRAERGQSTVRPDAVGIRLGRVRAEEAVLLDRALHLPLGGIHGPFSLGCPLSR